MDIEKDSVGLKIMNGNCCSAVVEMLLLCWQERYCKGKVDSKTQKTVLLEDVSCQRKFSAQLMQVSSKFW